MGENSDKSRSGAKRPLEIWRIEDDVLVLGPGPAAFFMTRADEDTSSQMAEAQARALRKARVGRADRHRSVSAGLQAPAEEVLRYGVFRIGGSWCVVSPGQPNLAFADRDRALEAVRLICTTHRVARERCEVLILDEAGRLIRLPGA